MGAYLVSINVLFGCFFAYTDIDKFSLGPQPDPDTTAGYFRIGLYGYEDPENDRQCIVYYQDDIENTFGPMMTAARVCAAVGSLFLAIAMVPQFFLPCFAFPEIVTKLLAASALLGGLLEGMTFLIFGTKPCRDTKCERDIGTGLAVAAILLAFTNVYFLRKLPQVVGRESHRLYGYPGLTAGTTTTTETKLPDGSRKIVRATMNKDGSLTIEETTIQMEEPVFGHSSDEESSSSEEEEIVEEEEQSMPYFDTGISLDENDDEEETFEEEIIEEDVEEEDDEEVIIEEEVSTDGEDVDMASTDPSNAFSY